MEFTNASQSVEEIDGQELESSFKALALNSEPVLIQYCPICSLPCVITNNLTYLLISGKRCLFSL